MRNGSIWSNVVFEKEAIFHEFDFETTDLEFEVSKASIWTHTSLCDNGVFYFIIISQFRRLIELKSSQILYIFCICWDTAGEKTGLWQLSIVSNIFKLYNAVLVFCFNRVVCNAHWNVYRGTFVEVVPFVAHAWNLVHGQSMVFR